ncbi:MAG: DUF480 domain-containing protein [Desulfobulbus sp.]|nr:DUF480 domain-containing protein [Desulfobulbus sp.]
MELKLDAVEVRVLGCLLEKELATPEYYPLSLNALVNACNQKTNRHPVLALSAEEVGETLQSLKELQYVVQSDAGRVAKFWQSLSKQYNLVNREAALLGLLLLRGPQTPGELRSRAENMCPFENLEQVAQSLDSLIARSLVMLLPRQPGQKEQRYCHLLAGEPEEGNRGLVDEPVVAMRRMGNDRIEALEEKVAQLEADLAELREAFRTLKQSLGE